MCIAHNVSPSNNSLYLTNIADLKPAQARLIQINSAVGRKFCVRAGKEKCFYKGDYLQEKKASSWKKFFRISWSKIFRILRRL